MSDHNNTAIAAGLAFAGYYAIRTAVTHLDIVLAPSDDSCSKKRCSNIGFLPRDSPFVGSTFATALGVAGVAAMLTSFHIIHPHD
jgi:hypothetical protein